MQQPAPKKNFRRTLSRSFREKFCFFCADFSDFFVCELLAYMFQAIRPSVNSREEKTKRFSFNDQTQEKRINETKKR